MDLTNGQKWAVIVGGFGLAFTVVTGGVGHLNKLVDDHFVTRSFMNDQINTIKETDTADYQAQINACVRGAEQMVQYYQDGNK